MGVGGDGERGWREGENVKSKVNTQTLCSNMKVYIYMTVYRKRDHVPQKLIVSYRLQQHLRKTLAKLRFLAYNTC